MGDPFKRLTRGEDVSKVIRRGEGPFNAAWFDHVTTHAKRGIAALVSGDASHYPDVDAEIWMYNASTTDIPQGGVAGFGGVLSLPSIEEDLFLSETNLYSTSPAVNSLFAIALEPIQQGEIGRVKMDGVVKLRVDVGDETHLWAAPESGTYDHLVSRGTPGPIRLLWKEGGTGTQYGLGRFECCWQDGNNTISVPTATLTWEGFAPTITSDSTTVIDVPLASLTWEGLVPSISPVYIKPPSVGTLTWDGFAPLLKIAILPPKGDLTWVPLAPTITATSDAGALTCETATEISIGQTVVTAQPDTDDLWWKITLTGGVLYHYTVTFSSEPELNVWNLDAGGCPPSDTVGFRSSSGCSEFTPPSTQTYRIRIVPELGSGRTVTFVIDTGPC